MVACSTQQGAPTHTESVLQKAHELLMHTLSVISQIEAIAPSVHRRLGLLAATMSILTPILENYIAEDVLQVCYTSSTGGTCKDCTLLNVRVTCYLRPGIRLTCHCRRRTR